MATLALLVAPVWANIAIMKTEHYSLKRLRAFLKRRKIATLDQLQSALGDASKRTAFRKLEALSYLSSYSHRGMYYTLESIANFDARGLWCCQSVWFSRFGNLIETTQSFVQQSEAGYSATELREILHVKTKHTLVQLVRLGELQRETIEGRYIYLSAESKKYRSQRKARKRRKTKSLATIVVSNPDLAADEAKAVVLLFLSTLNERQRRLYAGLESLKLGHGGDHYIAELFGMDPHTVAHGRTELVEGDWDEERLRASGAGRASTKKKRRRS
jgi:hypothetical protein